MYIFPLANYVSYIGQFKITPSKSSSMNFGHAAAMESPGIEFGELDAMFVDLDDTLVEYRNPCRLGLQELSQFVPGFRKAGLDAVEADFHGALRENLPKLFDNEITVNRERLTRLEGVLSRHGKKTERFELEFYDEVMQHVFWKNRKPVDSAFELLEMCKHEGIPVVVITNGNKEMQERTLNETGLGGLIDEMLVPENSGQLKPGTILFQKAAEIAGGRKSNTVMIGDSWNHDVMGAINFGVRPIWISNGATPAPGEAKVPWYNDLADLTRMWKWY